jgi:hypothetical protein
MLSPAWSESSMMPCDAWYSIDGSCKLLRQMAQVSVTRFHDQTATTFHFCTLCVRSKHETASAGCQLELSAGAGSEARQSAAESTEVPRVGNSTTGSQRQGSARCDAGAAAYLIRFAFAAPPSPAGSGSEEAMV